MSAVETSPSASTNLRDFLRLKDEDIGSAARRDHLSSNRLTVNTMLTMEQLHGSPSSHTSRTLLDIIRGDEANTSSSGGNSSGNLDNGKDKNSWRSLKDKIRMQINRNSNANSESSTAPNRLNSPSNSSSVESARDTVTGYGSVLVADEDSRDGENRGTATGRRSSTPFGSLVPISIGSNRQLAGVARIDLGGSELTRSAREVPAPRLEEPAREPLRCLSAALAEEREMSLREEPMPAVEAAGGGQGSRMSLMDLLEETDRQMGLEGCKYTVEEDERTDESCGVGEANNCCVCMVRQKGAAFIPCGHTFCRLCSRELWVSRGSCPICNGFILEVLDIF